MPSTLKKLTLAVSLFVGLGGCQGVYLQSPGEQPGEQPVQKPRIDPNDLPALIEQASYLGKECDSEEPSRVVQPKTTYASCEMGMWTMVDKAVLESRIVQYKTPRVTLMAINPINLGPKATEGKCVYTIDYATDYMEREFIDSTIKVDYDWILKLTLNQDKPAFTPADCKIQDSAAAFEAIQHNWNIDETTHKILGEKRPEAAPMPVQAVMPTPEPKVTNEKANVSRPAGPRASQSDLERKRIQASLPGI
ncbi:hypothetical protein V0M98_34305 (plasmid) [Pseudomonas silesiensis]|uniref:hypothetical protein n=1 Tax=Pseudomonas silesiensis TaxID=1853130 RepID=UPI0030CFBAF5